ncbi:hypothetical protein DV737_g2080, partial [Chaetothyriales sp. CBS 132003]
MQATHHHQAHNHHGRSRRAPRLPAGQNPHRQFRHQKVVKEVVPAEPPSLTAYRARFEAGRSFDLDDDLEFCPYLLTFDEVGVDDLPPPPTLASIDLEKKQSITSGSDRSSLSSGSPDSSPLQHQVQPEQIAPVLNLNGAAASFVSPPTFSNNHNVKVHQPSAVRSQGSKAIAIVNPSTGSRIASPPNSISPGMMQMQMGGRY